MNTSIFLLIFGVTLQSFSKGLCQRALRDKSSRQMFEAIDRGDEALALGLIGKINVNTQNNDGDTFLHLAIKKELPKVALALIKAGGKRFKSNKEGYLPYYYAITTGQIEVVKSLIEQTPSFFAHYTTHNGERMTYMQLAETVGQSEIVEFLKMKKSKYMSRLRSKKSKDIDLLFEAIDQGKEALALRLVKEVDTKFQNEDGDMPLHSAIKKRLPKVALALVKAGGKTFKQNNEGYFPLYYAITMGQVEVVQVLLNKTPTVLDKNIIHNRKRITYLQLAETVGQSEIVEIIRAVRINFLNKRGLR